MVPFGALNYLFMYKDSLQDIHSEWVTLFPDSAWLHGKRDKYTGKIIVRTWGGKFIKEYTYGSPNINSTLNSSIKSRTLSSLTGATGLQKTEDMVQPICIEIYHEFCGQRIIDKLICKWPPQPPVCALCDDPPTGGGSGGRGGGSAGPGDYPPAPNCNPNPNYKMPKYPAPAGYSWIMPCEGPETVPTPTPIGVFPAFDREETDFLSNNPDIKIALDEYFRAVADKIEAEEFYHWAIGYLKEYPSTYPNFKNVFLNGSSDLSFEDVQIDNNGVNILSANDYSISGISDYFTEAEFDNVIQNLSNDITEDPIQLYMIACYKNSKLLNSSTYSKPNNFQVGEYTLCPHYNSQNKLVFYSAFRKPSLGIEYLIRADALNAFKEKYTLYKSAANLFYVNGKPSYSQIQMSAGDYWEGLVESYKEAFSDPMYYLYLGHVFVGTATNLNTVPRNNPVKITPSPVNDPIKWTSTSIRNTVKVSITIENRTIAQYRDMISQKYNTTWQDIGNGKFKLEQNRYISNPAASSTEKPTIYYFRNGKDIGRFRFNN